MDIIYKTLIAFMLIINGPNAAKEEKIDMAKVAEENPFTDIQTVEEGSKIIGVEIQLPDELLNKYKLNNLSIFEYENYSFLQAEYLDDDQQIVIRVSNNTEDLNGNYSQTAAVKSFVVDKINVVGQSEEKGKISSATWTKEDIHYCFMSSHSIDISEGQEIIRSIAQ